MEKHTIKGKFLEKYFPGKKEMEIEWPTKLTELSALGKDEKILISGREFKATESQICQWAYRGFSLQHQGAEPMDEAQKEKAKIQRKAASSTVKAFASMDKAKQREIIETLEKSGHDCSAMRSAFNLPKIPA